MASSSEETPGTGRIRRYALDRPRSNVKASVTPYKKAVVEPDAARVPRRSRGARPIAAFPSTFSLLLAQVVLSDRQQCMHGRRWAGLFDLAPRSAAGTSPCRSPRKRSEDESFAFSFVYTRGTAARYKSACEGRRCSPMPGRAERSVVRCMPLFACMHAGII